jgi:creatinine amidohydrolase/Fe(II)-dependent formamide hydrolase-like protein
MGKKAGVVNSKLTCRNGLTTLIALGLSWCPMQSETSSLPDTVFLEEMTWPEVRQSIDYGKTTIIIPTGGTEQNVPHMVLGKHNFIVKHAAERIATALGNALVAPVLPYVPEGDIDNPEGHLAFAGTITLPEEYFIKVVEYASRSFKLHGFKTIVLIGDSGGNWDGLKIVQDALNDEWAEENINVYYIPEFNRGDKFRKWLLSRGETDKQIGSHAGIMDTSVMMAVDPAMIRSEKIAPSYRFAATGVYGDPTRANAAYGEQGLKFQIEDTVRKIRTLLSGTD